MAQYQQISKSLKDQMSFLVPWDCLKNQIIPKITADFLNIDLLWAKWEDNQPVGEEEGWLY